MTNPTTSIEDVPLNAFHRLLTLRSGGGSFVDGYVLSIIGVAMLQMTAALQLNSFWQGMIAASALVGIFFGGFLGGWLTDRLGRRRLFFVGPSLFVLASLAQYGVDSAAALFVLRFLIGVAVGIEYPVATALLVEFLPKKYRGPRLATLTILWFAGAAFAYLVGDLILRSGGEDAWRLVLASTAAIGAVLFLLRIGTPESPRWLLSKGRDADAERVIRQVYGEAFSLENLPEQALERKVTIWHLLYAGYGKRMLFVTLFWTCSVIPVFAVYAFAPKVLLALNLKGDWASYGSVAITLLFVIGCIIATRLINRIGRRCMLLHSFLWSAWRCSGWASSTPARRRPSSACSVPTRCSSAAPRCCNWSTRTNCSPPRSAPSRSASAPRYRASAPRWAPTWCRFPWKPWVPPRPCTPPRW